MIYQFFFSTMYHLSFFIHTICQYMFISKFDSLYYNIIQCNFIYNLLGEWLKLKKVIIYVTFDLLNKCRINILRRAKELVDYLVVAISSDEFNAGKGKKAYYTFEQRKAILEAIRYVDEVIPEDNWEQKKEDIP